MIIATAKKYWTDEELLALPDDGCDREIIDGELVVSPANVYHGGVIGRLITALGGFVFERGLGEILDGQTGVRMANGSLLSPDISFIRPAIWDAHLASGKSFLSMSPELVVEVLSGTDTADRMDEKLEMYFAHGTRLAWLVHPRSKSVHIHHERVATKILTVNDILDGGEVLPGFQLELAKLFR